MRKFSGTASSSARLVSALIALLGLTACGGLGGGSSAQSPGSATSTKPSSAGGSANVLTWHYDNRRTGWNDQETVLAPSNVNPQSFGKLFSYPVDGYLYAQPLYFANLDIGGARHNVVFAATENDSVYAFDADQYGSGAPLWRISLLQAGETPITGAAIQPVLGVTSTPVIDLPSGTLYVVSAQETSSGGFFRLHALDIASGAEKFGGPIAIQASLPGTNSDSVAGVISLTTHCVQRAALLLANNALFIGFGGCHSGWLLSYDARSLAQIAVFNMSPNLNGDSGFGGAGGVWMGGGGPAADSNGAVYVTTGNGPYDGSAAWGDSLLKFNTQLHLLDHFTPADWAFLSCQDLDLSGGGVMLIPGSTLAVVGGKQGKMFLLDTARLGGMQPNDAGATQSLWFEQDITPPYTTTCTGASSGLTSSGQANGYQIFGTAAFFNGAVYLGDVRSSVGILGPVRQFPFNGQLAYGASSSDSIQPGSYGTTPFISSNGANNGLVWMIDHGEPVQNAEKAPPTAAILRAYDANMHELYNSAQNDTDSPGLGIKFTSPIVANGKVYVGTAHDAPGTPNPQGELDVYGLK